MRVAVAGLGAAFIRGHLPALNRLNQDRSATLVGLADPDAHRRAAASAELGALPIFDCADTMLNTVESDVLIVAADVSSHAQLVVLGAQHRQHVLCEKPLIITRDQHELVVRTYGNCQELALVAVHQYRYSPMWIAVSRWARRANRLRIPFTLTVDVERNGLDARAVSQWRADEETSGGMLADHGVHYLALGWTISDDVVVLDARRERHDDARERAEARVRLGSGVLDLRLSAAAGARHSCITLGLPAAQVSWNDEHALLSVGGRTVRRWRTGALSDRRHIDALYLPLYYEMFRNLRDPSWRARRRAEALVVGGALVELLERAQSSVGVP